MVERTSRPGTGLVMSSSACPFCRNTFPREHHYRMSGCRTSNAHLNEHAELLREAVSHYPIPRPYFVVGREGPAFALS